MAIAKERPTSDSERQKNLNLALSLIEKAHGKGAIMRLSEGPIVKDVSVVSTGCLTLDRALGTGGVPRGRITEIFGPESSGKTTLTLHIIAEAQKAGLTCAFIDAEHALDAEYAEKLGVNLADLLVSQPDSGDAALDIVEKLVVSGVIDLIVVDSVAALVPAAEIKGDIGDAHVGLQARLMSQALRKITPLASKTNCGIVFINQIRDKIGVMMPGAPTTTTPGGRALKFAASVRMEIKRIGMIKETRGGVDENIGNKTSVKVAKNKLAPPFKVAEFEILFGKGISNEGSIIDLAVDKGIIERSGTWFSYNGDKIGQGRERVREFLTANPEIKEEILKKIGEAEAVNNAK